MPKEIPVELLRGVTHIVTHGNCADGLAAAIILVDALHKPVRFMRPGSQEHCTLSPAPGMLLCDIAPHPSRGDEFASSDVIVLDHHKQSQALVERCHYGIFADEEKEPGVSGALLALRHVWDPLVGPTSERRAAALDFATLVGISDTGQRSHPQWRKARALSSALHFFTPKSWLRQGPCVFGQPWFHGRLALGESLVAQHDRSVRAEHNGAHRFQSARGTSVLVVNSINTLTDMQDLEPDCDLIVGFHYLMDGGLPTMAVSMRSIGSFDCGALAGSRGGGGHTRAAGFQYRVSTADVDPYTFVRSIVDEYERSVVATAAVAASQNTTV